MTTTRPALDWAANRSKRSLMSSAPAAASERWIISRRLMPSGLP
jgi:hypothetical protein